MSKTARLMKDSGVEWIGEIPVGWGIARIKYDFYLKGRIGWQGLKAEEFTDDGPYLVTGTDFYNGSVRWSTCYHISIERYNEAPEIHVQTGDLLITKDGTVGKVAYIAEKPDKVSLNSHLLIIRPQKRVYSNRFLFWVLQSEIFDMYMSLSQNGTIMASLSQEKFSNFSYPLPPLPEQTRIATYLDEKCGKIDAVIAGEEAIIEKLKGYKQSLITETVTKGLNPKAPMKDSGIEWIGEIPAGWEVCRIKNILSILTDFTANGSFADLAKNVIYHDFIDYARLVRLTDLRDDLNNTGVYVDRHAYEYLSKSKLFGGEILIANVGAYAGYFCEMPKATMPSTLAPNMFLIRTNTLMLQHFLYYLGKSKFVSEQLEQKASMTTAQPKLNKDNVKTVLIPLPPLPEQKQIAAYLDKKCAAIDSNIASRQSLIEKLTAYKKSLIYEVVTGKKEV